MSADMEELLSQIRAEAERRGGDWLRRLLLPVMQQEPEPAPGARRSRALSRLSPSPPSRRLRANTPSPGVPTITSEVQARRDILAAEAAQQQVIPRGRTGMTQQLQPNPAEVPASDRGRWNGNSSARPPSGPTSGSGNSRFSAADEGVSPGSEQRGAARRWQATYTEAGPGASGGQRWEDGTPGCSQGGRPAGQMRPPPEGAVWAGLEGNSGQERAGPAVRWTRNASGDQGWPSAAWAPMDRCGHLEAGLGELTQENNWRVAPQASVYATGPLRGLTAGSSEAAAAHCVPSPFVSQQVLVQEEPLGERLPGYSTLEQSRQGAAVWIVGDSIIQQAEQRAKVRDNGEQLGFKESRVILQWNGVEGLCWDEVVPLIIQNAKHWGSPNMILIHCGGNDLGQCPMKHLIKNIRKDFLRLWSLFPGVSLVWSEIIPRLQWRGARSVSAIDRVRVKVNKAVSKFVQANGGVAIRHKDFDNQSVYYSADGVHLNEVGMELFNFTLRETIQFAWEAWRNMQS
ncbi:hypothetical protein XELAEV_18028586mg [Xenopus laevis]|uniref:SGNH hydrolase-type esterase domain-containing protein n=1 Tax=Xenopus laevis TaxID=8355 RepID=A0A974HGU0_XENLA|nr:hypothetical protein XELAEV_18028586mg [Xenopus laevis]